MWRVERKVKERGERKMRLSKQWRQHSTELLIKTSVRSLLEKINHLQLIPRLEHIKQIFVGINRFSCVYIAVNTHILQAEGRDEVKHVVAFLSYVEYIWKWYYTLPPARWLQVRGRGCVYSSLCNHQRKLNRISWQLAERYNKLHISITSAGESLSFSTESVWSRDRRLVALLGWQTW